MTGLRFFAIIGIFALVSIAWAILGGTIEYRTAALDTTLTEEVNARWGPSSLVQTAPVVTAAGATGKVAADPESSAIKVDFAHEKRYMGLVWFSTYTARFSGEYGVQAAGSTTGSRGVLVFRLPERAKTFEDLAVTLDAKPFSAETSESVNPALEIPFPADGQPHKITVSYAARGRDRWEYATAKPDSPRIPLIQNFQMTATADFRDIDYPKGSISPVKKAEETPGGFKAAWQYNNLRANQRMGLEMPAVPEAGRVAARMSFFAPVSLFFFFTVLVTVVMLKKIPLHPMHYLQVSAGFFAFHILLAYLVDLVPLSTAFWVCAAVSTFLVVSYMRLVAGVKFAVMYVGLAQVVYLVGFSYAFLWKGYTGLSVVIGAIVTLFVLMQTTGRVNWSEVFAAAPPRPPLSPPPVLPPSPQGPGAP
jgi:inner membrane protein involved in colicin E2 resistance